MKILVLKFLYFFKRKLKYRYENYLIKVGILSIDYPYSLDILVKHITYFKRCYKNGLSPYKALEFLYYELKN